MHDDESYASAVYRIISEEYVAETISAKEDGLGIKLECVSAFGLVTVAWISPATTADLIKMEVIGDNAKHSMILVPAASCSFRFSRFKPGKGEAIKIVGFGEKPDSN